MDRKLQLENWLAQVLLRQSFTLTTASADASFRRYFRVHVQHETLIAMDAPPPQEDFNMTGTSLAQQVDHVLKIFDMAALIA